jgi:hypothetical protein
MYRCYREDPHSLNRLFSRSVALLPPLVQSYLSALDVLERVSKKACL